MSSYVNYTGAHIVYFDHANWNIWFERNFKMVLQFMYLKRHFYAKKVTLSMQGMPLKNHALFSLLLYFSFFSLLFLWRICHTLLHGDDKSLKRWCCSPSLFCPELRIYTLKKKIGYEFLSHVKYSKFSHHIIIIDHVIKIKLLVKKPVFLLETLLILLYSCNITV